MQAPVRALQIAAAALVLLHVVASRFWPAELWGASQLAVWPWPVLVAWSLLGLVAIAGAPRLARLLPLSLPWPGRRATPLLLALSAALFWLLRERTHFFGDGYLIVRSQGAASTFWRGPLLVRPTAWVVRAAGRHLGLDAATALALVSVLAGVLAVYIGLRVCAALVPRREARGLAAALLATSGAVALFCGHVEYYAVLVPALLLWLLLSLQVLRGRLPVWPTWIASAVLFALHLSSVGLLPAQLWLGIRAWRRGDRLANAVSAAVAVLLALALVRLAGSSGEAVATQSTGSLQRYIAPYFDPASSRHAFGLFAPAHFRALLNDLLLVAPLALVVFFLWLGFRQRATGGISIFLSLAALGCSGLDFLFNRELGPYRDWDTLAPYAFVLLAWSAVALLQIVSAHDVDADARPGPEPSTGPSSATDLRAVVLLVVAGGAFHLVPWLALNVLPAGPMRHLQLALQDRSSWSPYASGYMHEEFAIWARDRGDDAGALREYQAASAANPSDARYHLGLGDMYARRGDAANAEREYEISVRHRPSWPMAHNNLAVLLANQRVDLERAREHARTAYRLAPDNFNIVMTYGYVEMLLGDYGAARAAFERAAALQPGSEKVRLRLEELRGLEAEEHGTGAR